MSTIKVGDMSVTAGEVGLGKMLCGYLPDSSPVHVPLIIVNGAKPGPTLWVGAVMHGTEIGGIEVIRRVLREEIDPTLLSGAIIGTPIINPFAYRAATTRTPQDGQNLNRTFPGGATQLLSGRLAHLLTTELLPQADFLIDIHSNMSPALLHTIVHGPASSETVRKCEEMADAFGATKIVTEANIEDQTGVSTVRTSGANLPEWAHSQGKPAIAVELAGTRQVDVSSVCASVTGVINVVKYLGMLSGKPVLPEYAPIIPGRLSRITITANKGGIVEILANVGTQVAKGDPIAYIRDPWGDIVEEIVSPVKGFPLAFPMQDNQAVGTGDYVVFVAYRKEDQ